MSQSLPVEAQSITSTERSVPARLRAVPLWQNPASLASPTNHKPFSKDTSPGPVLTRIDVAVAHSVDSVLALSILLAEDGRGELTHCREGRGVSDVKQVNHLIGHVQCLEAPLVFLPEDLRESKSEKR